jgi:hypothetical protein
MKSTSLGSRNIAVVIILVVVAGLVYFYYQGGSAPSAGSLLQGVPSGASVGSAELTLLSQIQSLKIDTTLFTNAAYATLQDYSVEIPPQNVGRPNPFAPFAGAPAAR